MADEWWKNDQIAGQPAPVSSGRIGYIPGVPKAKDPIKAETDELDLKIKQLDYDKKQRDLANGGGDEKTTADEKLSGGYYLRALNAHKLYGAGVNPRDPYTQAAVDNIIPQGITNKYSSPERRAAENYAEEFIRAKLRKESGASISPMEKATEYPVYFPVPGDEAPDLERKAKLREVVIQGLRLAAGREAGRADSKLAEMSGEQPDNQTDNGTHIHDNSQERGNLGLSTGGTHTETDPRLQGSNAEVNALIKGGSSDKEILALLKGRGADTASLIAVKTQLNDIRKFQKKNPGYKGDFNVDLERHDVPNSGWNNIAAGPAGAAGLAMADTFTGGHVDNVVGALGGDAELANLGVQLSREQNPGASLAGDIAGGAALYATGAGLLRGAAPAAEGAEAAAAASKVGALAPKALAGDAAMGGYIASGQGGTQAVDPWGSFKGAGLGLLAGGATRGALNTAGAVVSPTGGALAPLYEAGVRPTIGQRMGAGNFVGRSLNRAEQAFGSVPILGGIQRSGRNAAVGEMQKGAFNSALGEIGLQLPKGVTKGKQAHAFMQKAFDDVYDKARSGMRFSPDEGFAADIDAIAEDAGMLFPESRALVQKISNDIGSKINTSGGTLSGDQFKVVVSKLGKKIGALRSNPSGDTELADVLDSMKTAIENAARRQSNPEAVALLDAADRGYAKAVIIENAGKSRGGEAGEFGGNALDASVQRTSKSRRSRAYQSGKALMQEYGEAAKKLGDELPDSGTAERAATLAAAGGAAHFISPAALLPWAADTAANLPGVRQTLGLLMAPRPIGVRNQTDAIRGFLERLAAVSPAVAIPAAE